MSIDPIENLSRWTASLGLACLVTVALLVSGCDGSGEDDANPTGPTHDYDRGPLQLTVTASADPITTAETLALQLDATLDDGYNLLFPAYPEPEEIEEGAEETDTTDTTDTAFTFLSYEDSAPVLLEDGRIRRQRTYYLEPFLEGRYTIPSLELRFGAEGEVDDSWMGLQTDPLTITVASVLPPDEAPTPEGIVGPVGMQNPTPWGWYSFWLLVLAGLLGGGYYYWFVREAPAPPPPPPVAPEKRALEALEILQRKKLIEQGMYKEYYIAISDVLRHYMEDQFGFQASERTTEEFLQELQHSALLGLQEQLLLKDFLRLCDLVKFAKTEPTSEEIESTYGTCKQFIKDTAEAQKKAARAALEGV